MTTNAPTPPSLQAFIDGARLGRRQRLYILVIFLVMLADGLDITIMSHLFPPLAREWGIGPAQITLLVSGAVVGMTIGALVAGRAADRWGRRSVTIACLLLIGLGTLSMALAPNIEVLTGVRIISAVGLGGVMPVVLTLAADLVPTGRRAQLVTLAFTGVPFGTIVGAYLAAALIPSSLGWRALVVAGGVIPLVVLVLFAALVPESPLLLAGRKATDRARAALTRLIPGSDADTIDFSVPIASEAANKGAFREIVSRGTIVVTVLLWVYAFLGQGTQLLVQQYLPTLLQMPDPGLDSAQSGLVVSMLGWGALIGTVTVSFSLKRFNRFWVAAFLMVVGIGVLIVLATVPLGFAGLMITMVALGLFMNSGIGLTNTLSSLSYPARARATGVGAANSVGRVGTLASGIAGGALIGAGWAFSGVIGLVVAPLGVLAVTVLGLGAATKRAERRRAREQQLERV